MTTGLLPAPIVSIGVHVETWLNEQTAVGTDQPIVWCPHGYRRGGEAVRSIEHLSVLASARPRTGEWAVIEWSSGEVRGWCQTMRYPTGWVVDAHDETPDDFAKRVYRARRPADQRTSTSCSRV